MTSPMVDELRAEAATTKRLLDRVPDDKLAWKPHPKSMSLGQLAFHVARLPGELCQLVQVDEFDASTVNFDPPVPGSKEDILAAFERSVSGAAEFLSSMSAESAGAEWRLTVRGREVFTIPRIGVVRSFLLNHWYHHRGQLSVYLRLLDIPVPAIYGRSADENPLM